MEGYVQGLNDYSLTPVRAPQPSPSPNGKGEGEAEFELLPEERRKPRSQSPLSAESEARLSEELPVGHPDQDEAGRHIDVIG